MIQTNHGISHAIRTNRATPIPPSGLYPPVLVRADEAEHIASLGHFLLADADVTGGALSSHRVALPTGADGAVPHHHRGSSELFHVWTAGSTSWSATRCRPPTPATCSIVPPGLSHAFGAHPGSTAEALIVITPGVRRFEYFRLVQRTAPGWSRRRRCA